MAARDPDPRTDAELVDAMNAADRSAFEAMYFRYRDWVLRLARSSTGHDDDALDVLQETFKYFFAKFPGFALSAQITTFLYKPVINASRAARAKRQRLHLAEAPEPPCGAPAQDPPLDDLEKVLSCLPADQRQAVMLRFVHGLDIAEIAQAVDAPAGTIKSRIHYALRTLRDDPRTRRYFDQESE